MGKLRHRGWFRHVCDTSRTKTTDCCKRFHTAEYKIKKLEKITLERRTPKLYYNDGNGTAVLLVFVSTWKINQK